MDFHMPTIACHLEGTKAADGSLPVIGYQNQDQDYIYWNSSGYLN